MQRAVDHAARDFLCEEGEDTCLAHGKERDFTRIAGNLNALWLAGASVAALTGKENSPPVVKIYCVVQ